MKKENKAIEHLIEAYRKQQALIEGVKYEYMPPDVSFVVMYKDDFDRNFGNYYIPKSKIKEKIEELERDKKKLYEVQGDIEDIRIYSYIDIIKAEVLRLQELLEEE